MARERRSRQVGLSTWGDLQAGPAEGECYDPGCDPLYLEAGLTPPHLRDPDDPFYLPTVEEWYAGKRRPEDRVVDLR